MPDMTVGGAIAAGRVGRLSGKHGTVADNIERMEVVLANGDLMETGRITKRDLSRKKGEQTLEGEIYRQIDGIIDDNAELIASLSSDNDNIGYRIDKIKAKDGSFDLTPLFVGSQGTLGVISEIVLKTGFYSDEESILVAVCQTAEEARDITDVLRQLDPTTLEVIDGEFYEEARARGKRFVFDKESDIFAGLVYATFDDFSSKVRARKLKKAQKLLAKREAKLYTSDDARLDDLYAVRDVEQTVALPLRVDESPVFMCDGAYVPSERLEEFIGEVSALAEKLHVKLSLKINALTGIVSTYPTVHFKKISDKQKIFKLATEYAALVHKTGGTIAGAQAEGRINAFAGYAQLDEAVVDLNASIRKVFDPFATLNPGVKQVVDLKVLARQLRSE
jgi:FAD/FMN-containing dehydrogenase